MSDFNKYLEERQQKNNATIEAEKQEKLNWNNSVQALYNQIKDWFANQQYITISENKPKHGDIALQITFNGSDTVTIDPKETRLQIIGYGVKVIGPKGNFMYMALSDDNEWTITDAGPFKANIERFVAGDSNYKKELLTQKSFEEMIKSLLD